MDPVGPAEAEEPLDSELPEIPDADEPLDEEIPDAGEPPGPAEVPGEPAGAEAGRRPGGREPAAEVGPGTVEPGGTVTVSVSCPGVHGTAPAVLDATSQAFDEGTVALRKVPGDDDKGAGPAYRGTARIAPAANFEGGPDSAGPDTDWTVDGTCPRPRGAGGPAWSATFTVLRPGGKPCPEPVRPGGHCGTTKPPCPVTVRPGEPCDAPPPPHGVHAGQGGAFTDSVPALVAGGVLIAGALAAAAHRLRFRDRAAGR
ncbi:hypothetical protein ABZ397_15150 [Streptomyces sp. NPDC005876]|uniref:hypothetical protein n=1 Tax=Streptomyces sp. NPDC005876 TaxID=3157076 RepID=UPI0033C0EE41